MKSVFARSTELVLLALMFSTATQLTACNEGPLEEAGEEVDDALDDAGDELD